jgi:hypothetical protein
VNKSMALVIVSCLSLCAFGANGKTRKSEALQIAEAAKFDGLRDVSQKELAKALKLQPGIDPVFALMAIGVGTGWLEPTPGMGVGTEMAANIVFALFDTGTVYAKDVNILAWMPRTEATNEMEAQAKYKAVINEALQRGFETDVVDWIPFPAEVAANWSPSSAKLAGSFHVFSFASKICESQPLGKCFVHVDGVYRGLPKSTKAPVIMGKYPAYGWVDSITRTYTFGLPTSKDFAETQSLEARMQAMVKFSTELPSWVYIYVPPAKHLYPYPFILNKGKKLLFIEPKEGE